MDAVSGYGDGMVAGRQMTQLKAPPGSLVLREWPRAAMTVARLAGSQARLKAAPPGDGRPVLVLPGLFNSDLSNGVLRGFLNRIGYRAYPWGLGRNLGTRVVGKDGEKLFARVEAIVAEAGQPVTLVGVSLGGIMARFVAHRRPDLVRGVVTISAPFAASPRATNVWRFFELLTGEKVDDPDVATRQAEIIRPLPVPVTAIWSASDGLVNGRGCRIAEEPSIEVVSSHVGVQLNPDVLVKVAEVLAAQ